MGDGFGAEIRNNVLSHNRRSGIFLWHNANIHDNRIKSNGASGIFLGGETGFDGSGIVDDIIVGNHDFGVAVPHRNVVDVRANSIAHNGGGGIDVGLDGRTMETDDSFMGPIVAPHIDSARFDAASGDTIIEGPTPFGFSPRTIYLYANTSLDADGFAEGERFLGSPQFADGRFTLRVRGSARAVRRRQHDRYSRRSDHLARHLGIRISRARRVTAPRASRSAAHDGAAFRILRVSSWMLW